MSSCRDGSVFPSGSPVDLDGGDGSIEFPLADRDDTFPICHLRLATQQRPNAIGECADLLPETGGSDRGKETARWIFGIMLHGCKALGELGDWFAAPGE